VIIANPEAKRLYEELIKVRSYNKLIRPVKNNSEKLTVYLGLRLTQLLDVVCILFVLIERRKVFRR
jgi:nicotinic acetylcholine receptor